MISASPSAFSAAVVTARACMTSSSLSLPKTPTILGALRFPFRLRGGSGPGCPFSRLALLKALFHLDEIRLGVAIASQLVLPARLCDSQPDPGRDRRRRHAELLRRFSDRVKPLRSRQTLPLWGRMGANFPPPPGKDGS